MRRIGHKGADAIVPGNTVASFGAAVRAGVEMIEFDVLRPRSDFADGRDWKSEPAGPASGFADPLLVAHDWGDAHSRPDALTLGQGLDAFTTPALATVEIDCDLKVAGREDEVVQALRERGLIERAMISTMEVESLREIRRLAPELRLGWTVPRITRDWTTVPAAKPLVVGGLIWFRARLPGLVRRTAPDLGVKAIWAYSPVVTPRLARACHSLGLELYAWTVDDVPTMRRLAAVGVDGICSNDPRLFAEL